MAECWNTHTGDAVYRSRDAVKNLKIKVRIQRVTSTAVLSQHLQHQVLTQKCRKDIELKTLTSQAQTGDNEEEVVVGWQEKLFSQYEVELFQNEAACQTPLDRQYHSEIRALNKAKGRRNQRIFTYTDHDRYTNCFPLHQLHNDLVSTTKSSPTFLAERMASVRHRRQERRTTDSSITKSRIINWDPTDEFVKSSHVVNNAMQTMHIMGDLGPPGKLGQKENECLLATIKTDGSGTIIVKPNFNKGREPYRIVSDGKKREVWRLTLENASRVMKPEEREREQIMYKDLYSRHKEYLNSLVGQDFEMPPIGVVRYLLHGEIVSASDFEFDNLYINFFMDLPNSESHTILPEFCRLSSKNLDSEFFTELNKYSLHFFDIFKSKEGSVGQKLQTNVQQVRSQSTDLTAKRTAVLRGLPVILGLQDMLYWSSLPFQLMSGVTQTCRTKSLGKENVAFFSYPFSFEAFYMSEKENEELIPQWPVLYFKVLSLDFWQRYRTEGYGYLLFPTMPGESSTKSWGGGKHTVTCHTWRPVQTGIVSALRRFFIGGSAELEDNSYVRVPGTFKGERLSRFGFSTETTGSVTFRLHCMQQARAFADAALLKKRRQKVVDHLGGFSQQGMVCSILEAYQRAHKRLQEARESLPRDVLNSHAQHQPESSA